MSQEVADLFVTLRGVTGEFNKSMSEAGAASERADGKIAGLKATAGKMALGFGAAAVTVGVVSVKLASEFDRTMEQIHTLAGVPESAIKGLSAGVLGLAGQVGFAPNSLAEALYHVESSFASTGISGKQAMDILTVAAKGAQIGHANLVDVTNALDAAVVSGIPGVQNYGDAMTSLLTIVGSGDMTMQNLADAFSTGILAIGKQYGATLTDVGAALATFGDNNIRGQVAATDLRMAIMDLTKQGKPGVAALESIGIASGQLGKDMQTGGMNKAIIDLKKHLDAAGVTGTKVGKFLEDAFTKKSSAPLAVLLGQFDRLQSKYAELNKGTGGFGEKWKATAAQFSVQVQQIKAQGEAWAIMLGNLLIPVLSKVISTVMDVVKWFQTHKKAAQELGTIIKDVLVGGLIMAAAVLGEMAIEAATAAAPFVILAVAIGALANYLVDLYKHNAKFKESVDKVVSVVKDLAVRIKDDLIDAYGKLVSILSSAHDWMQKHKTIVGALLTAVAAAAAVWALWTAAVSAWALVTKAAAAVQLMFNAVMDANPVMLVVIAIAALAAGLIYAYKHSKTFRDIVDGIGRALKEKVAPIIKTIVDTFKRDWPSIQELLGKLGDIITTKVVPAFEKIGSFITTKVVPALEWLGKQWVKLTEAMIKVLVPVIETVIKVLGKVLKVFLDLGSFLLDLFGGKWKKLWGDAKKVFTDAFDAFFAWIVRVGQKIGQWFMDLPGLIWSKVKDAGNWLVKTGKDLIGGALSGIKSTAGTLLNWFANLPSAIWSAVGNVVSAVSGIGYNIVIGIWNGIQGMAGWLWQQVANFAGGILDSIKSALHINSPSKLMSDIVGKGIVEGIAHGINAHAHLAHAAMANLATGLTGVNLAASPGQLGYGAAAGGGLPAGGGVGITVQHTTVLQLDGKAVGRSVESYFLSKGQTRGTSYQNYKR